MDTNLLDWRCFCRVCATWLLQWAFPGVKFSQMWLWSLLHKWFKRGEAGDYLLSNWKENQCLLSNLSCEREAQVVLEPQLQHYCCGMENGVWNHPPLGYPSNSGTSQIGNSYQEHESLVCIQVIKGMMSWRLTYSANTALVLAVLVFGLALLFDMCMELLKHFERSSVETGKQIWRDGTTMWHAYLHERLVPMTQNRKKCLFLFKSTLWLVCIPIKGLHWTAQLVIVSPAVVGSVAAENEHDTLCPFIVSLKVSTCTN